MQDGLKKAIEVPLSVMRISHSCWDHMITIAKHGNKTALSDIQVINISNFMLLIAKMPAKNTSFERNNVFLNVCVTCVLLLQVGGCSLHTGLRGAYFNVCINLEQVSDQAYTDTVREEVERISQSSQDKCQLLLDTITQRKQH